MIQISETDLYMLYPNVAETGLDAWYCLYRDDAGKTRRVVEIREGGEAFWSREVESIQDAREIVVSLRHEDIR